MRKVIVIGSNGQLGRTIKDCATKETLEFYFFFRSELDITDKKSLMAAFKDSGFDYCVNCAAYTNVEDAEANTEDAFLVNAEGAKNVAEVCNTYQVKLIHISTDYVFDGKKNEPYTITDQTNPINQYGKSKLQGELDIQEHLEEFYIIRTSWLYSLYGKNFLKTIINKLEDGSVLNITTEEQGTPTSCVELAEFIIYLVKSDKTPYGIYNFSANGSTTWFGFAQEIAKHLPHRNSNQVLPTDKFKTLAKRPKYSLLNLKKRKLTIENF
ncbi:dTDP-4-dehydrorhamnose reductase [Winogradskyella helgolandensis]|uniref:dTDP-4-dehydrorhamnose reductase n=1 Tax=Winogradskyella helgolandensis TaxID=2697010 RepID=UPI0015B9245F|nr:dTDP-4-dehydrorhamnose reductase [Winogradskyella helgolandensis]